MNEELWVKVLLKEATVQEQRELQDWLKNHPSYQALFEELIQIVSQTDQAKYNTVAALVKFRARIQTAEEESAQRTSQEQDIHSAEVPLKNRFFSASFLWVAASLLILAGAGWMVYTNRYLHPVTDSPITWKEVFTGKGERKRVTLPDGTQVWLSATSRLRYPVTFQENKREVYMDGELFFDVHRNEQKPFIIQTNMLTVQVLGTSFQVRSFAGQPSSAVTVASGKVAVRAGNKPLATLTANQLLVFTKKNQHVALSMTQTANEETWKDGHLLFNKMTFGDIAQELERYYDVEINFANLSLKKCVFKASFKPMPLENVLNIMKQTVSFQYTYHPKSKKVWIRGKGC